MRNLFTRLLTALLVCALLLPAFALAEDVAPEIDAAPAVEVEAVEEEAVEEADEAVEDLIDLSPYTIEVESLDVAESADGMLGAIEAEDETEDEAEEADDDADAPETADEYDDDFDSEDWPVALTTCAITIGKGETCTVPVNQSETYLSMDELVYISDDDSVVKAYDGGKIKGVGVGTTTVYVYCGDNYAELEVTVKNAPTKVSVSFTKKNLPQKGGITLKAKLPGGTASRKLTWSTSNKKVAKVSSKGRVTAVKPGKATITVKTFNGKKGTCKITVLKRRQRALLIGQDHYSSGLLPGCVNDAVAMSGMLKRLSNPFDTKVVKDASASKILKYISSYLVKGSKNSDISLFFYSGHGCYDGGGSYQGALCGVNNTFITTKKLAAALKKVKGKVYVIVDACHSGALIGRKGITSKAAANGFAQSLINELAGETITVDGTDANGKSGEFRMKKFYVLVAAGFWQSSVCGSFDGSGYDQGAFTAALLMSVGATYPSGVISGSMPGDYNKDKRVSLSEACKYIKQIMNDWGLDQTTMMYGKGSELWFSRI